MISYLKISILLFLLFLVGCSDESVPVNEPEVDVGLSELASEARNLDGLRSLLIGVDDQLILEEYYGSFDPDSLDQVRSVTKSIMTILIGMAIDKNFIPDPEVKISEYIGHMEGFEDRHKDITLHHLLTMSGGFQWDESQVDEFNDWVLSENRISYLLKRQVVDDPGSVFNYNSAQSHLLSVILQEASGMTARKYADEYLFGPLSIEIRWQRLDDYTNGASGLRFKPIDMLKLGQLMVNNGNVDGKQLISPSWIETSLQPHIATGQVPEYYGYQWWVNPDIDEIHGMAIGYGGQYLIVIPELNAVIVTTSEYRNIGQEKALQQSKDIYQFIWSNIYPYLKGN